MTRPAKADVDREHYRAVATVYNEAKVREGRAVQAVAQRWDVPYNTAARWVKRCRQLNIPLVESVCRGRCPKCCPPREETK